MVFQYSAEQPTIYKISDLLTAVLSIIGCFSIILICILLRDYKRPLGKMVLSLSLMNLTFNFFGLIREVFMTSEFLCHFASALSMFGIVSSLALTCCFSHALYQATITRHMEVQIAPVKRYIYVSITLGILFAGVRIIGKTNYIDESQKCAARPDLQNWLLILFRLLPQAIASSYCLICYLIIILSLRKLGTRYYFELLLYPFVLIICYMPLAIMQVYSQLSEAEIPFVWNIIARTLFGCQGIFNALVYGLSRRIITQLKQKCCQRATPSDLNIRMLDKEAEKASIITPNDGGERTVSNEIYKTCTFSSFEKSAEK